MGTCLINGGTRLFDDPGVPTTCPNAASSAARLQHSVRLPGVNNLVMDRHGTISADSKDYPSRAYATLESEYYMIGRAAPAGRQVQEDHGD
jgi:hypothetical protein